MSIAYVQSNIGGTGSSATSTTCNYTGAQTATNQNIVAVFVANGTSLTPTVTDTKGNTYTQIASELFTAQDIQVYLFACWSIISATAGANTVTATVGSSASFGLTVIALEYSGVSSTQDGSTEAATGNASSYATPTLTTTNATDLVLAIVGGGSAGTATAGSGYTLRQSWAFAPWLVVEDQITASTGSFTGPMTGPSQQFAEISIAFKAAGAGSQTIVLPAISSTISVPSPSVSGGVTGNIWVSNGADVGGSGSYVSGTQSVQYCHDNFASAGDEIQIPNGTYTWTTGVSITKGVAIIGQTAGSAFVVNNVTGNFLTAASGTDNHILIANLNIYNETSGGGSYFMFTLGRNYSSSTNPYTVIVRNCVFNSANLSGGGSYAVHLVSNGIIFSSCTFIGCGSYGLTGIFSDCTGYGYTQAWNYLDTIGASNTYNPGSSIQLGTGDVNTSLAPAGLNNTYVENCTFYDATNTVLDADENTRIVFRNNTLINANVGSHGQETSVYGVRHWEMYGNTFKCVLPGTSSGSEWTLTSGITQPVVGSTTTATLNSVTGLFVGQLVSLNTYDLYSITAINTGTKVITIQNLGWPSSDVHGTSITAQNLVGPSGQSYNIFNGGLSGAGYGFPYWILLRGGTGVIHDNTIPDISTATGGGFSSAAINISDFGVSRGIDDGLGGTFWVLDPAIDARGYPAPRQFGWGWSSTSSVYSGYGTDATHSSVLVGGTSPSQFAPDSTGLILDPAYFWNNGQAQSSGSFVNVFLYTPNANPNSSTIAISSFIQSGREYYTNGSTLPGYTEYTFPHPLSSDGNGGGGSQAVVLTSISSSLSVQEPSLSAAATIVLSLIYSTLNIPAPTLHGGVTSNNNTWFSWFVENVM